MTRKYVQDRKHFVAEPNKWAQRYLEGHPSATEHPGRMCADGTPRNLVEVDYDTILRMRAEAEERSLEFKTYVSVDDEKPRLDTRPRRRRCGKLTA